MDNQKDSPKKGLSDEEKENQQKSSAEIVGHNKHLMKLIIKNIPNARERKNLNLVCKMFHEICHDKHTFVECLNFSKESFLNERRRLLDNEIIFDAEENPIVQFFEDYIYIEISHFNRCVVHDIQGLLLKLKGVGLQYKMLDLGCIPEEFIDVLGSLKCFGNIETVVFSTGELKCTPLNIFKKCSDLKPKNVIFKGINGLQSQHICNGEVGDISNILPDSIKIIKLCFEFDVESMYQIIKYYDKGHFDTLIINDRSAYNGFLENAQAMETIKCFKSVEVFLLDFLEMDIKECIYYTMADNERSLSMPGVNISFNLLLIHVIARFSISNRYYDRPTSEEGSIHDNFIDIQSLCEELHYMKNLTTLIIDYSIIKSFSQLCTALKRNLKNVAILSCSLLNIFDIKTLSESEANIENLWLFDVLDSNITFKSIIMLFGNLKGLSIDYNSNYNPLNIIKDLKKEQGEGKKEYLKIEWPDIYFLKITCRELNEEEERLLKEMEYQSPRIPGYFLAEYFTNDEDIQLFQFVFQKNLKYFDVFKNFYYIPYMHPIFP
uniref:F-box domain-containing protein n=1 Tax=Parastrongyloides trichosuri TaxID=131310 RepID=A0A0N4ZYX9_PARTI